jgi:fucose permease
MVSLVIVIMLCILKTPENAEKKPDESDNEDKSEYSGCNYSLQTIILMGIFFCFYVGGECGFGSFILVYSHLQLDFPEAQGQYLCALFWIFMSVGRLLAVPLASCLH